MLAELFQMLNKFIFGIRELNVGPLDSLHDVVIRERGVLARDYGRSGLGLLGESQYVMMVHVGELKFSR